MDTKLNLPLWKSSKVSTRVSAARARALKVSSDIVKSVPINSSDYDANNLETIINKILSLGTIKSLEEVYELTGVSNPHPTKAENESSLNKSGYTVVDGSNFFKLTNSDNVEAIRMLYNAGLTIDEIRSKLSSMKEGDTLILKCGKTLKKFPKQDYVSLLNNYPTFRGYQEYLTDIEANTYAVCDTPNGNLSTFVLYIEQDSNNKAYLQCKECKFPIQGTLVISTEDINYEFELSANSYTELLIQLDSVNSSLEFNWNKGLVIKSNNSFQIEESDVAEALGIKNALLQLKDSIQLGFSGGEILQEDDFYKTPYNISVKKPDYSRSNSLNIYKQLVNAGIDSYICDAFLDGSSLYEAIEERSNALKEALSTSTDKDLIQSYSDSLYKTANVRILGTSRTVIDRLLSMDDYTLEYLLRYRYDIVGIDPYTSNEEVRDSLIKLAKTSSSGSYFTKQNTTSDEWKQNTANVRTVEVYETLAFSTKDDYTKKNWLDITYEFLDSVVYFYNKDLLNKSGTYYSNNTLGLGIATSVNLGASFSFAHGLDVFSNIESEIPTDFIEEFEGDMLVIQAYLDSAFQAFDGVCGKLANIIHICNASLGVSFDAGTGFNISAGSILQCSLNVDLCYDFPIYIPQINEISLQLIAKLEAVADALIELERSLLCPIQNLLDKYVNTSGFLLPCKISYSVPLISGLDAYLKGYIDALNGLKIMCNVSKRDVSGTRFGLSMMPSSLNLLVTNSESCQES